MDHHQMRRMASKKRPQTSRSVETTFQESPGIPGDLPQPFGGHAKVIRAITCETALGRGAFRRALVTMFGAIRELLEIVTLKLMACNLVLTSSHFRVGAERKGKQTLQTFKNICQVQRPAEGRCFLTPLITWNPVQRRSLRL